MSLFKCLQSLNYDKSFINDNLTKYNDSINIIEYNQNEINGTYVKNPNSRWIGWSICPTKTFERKR
ncbi:hypothetical protein RB653_007148 [Dictyostelium firmibasis]|uniref:Uncharacterized protein n=1 Tax=Dictyostelium firmibasis TaxID=79012 RepID=A0AAN7TU47_9MYCE